MVPHVRGLAAALTKDLGLVPSNQRWLATICNYSPRRSNPSSDLHRHQALIGYTYMHVGKTFILII